MKENHLRKVWKSEERKVKNIGKNTFCTLLNSNIIEMECKFALRLANERN